MTYGKRSGHRLGEQDWAHFVLGKCTEWTLPTALMRLLWIVADPRGPILFEAYTSHTDSRGVQTSVDK